jgi:glycerol uptake facilitator-like aquaporin
VAYWIAQLVGAVLGAGALTLAYLDVDRNRVELGLPMVGSSLAADPPESLTTWNALAMEAILTFFLMFVVYGVAFDRRTGGRAVAGLAIGFTITMGVLAGGAVSGAAINPARWFGPAVIQQEFADFWVWIVGPAIGAVVAALLFNEFLMGRYEGDEVEEYEVTTAVSEHEARPAAAVRRRRRRR